jgi:hypothetical protein
LKKKNVYFTIRTFILRLDFSKVGTETPRNERQARHGAIYFAERAGRQSPKNAKQKQQQQQQQQHYNTTTTTTTMVAQFFLR